MNITVYCGVSEGNSPTYKQTAIDLGTWIAEAGHKLVYGGGGIGMMGLVSGAVLDHGGDVLGIIPQFLVDREQFNVRLKESIVVETMAERKALLQSHADAFVMLPGGIGTFEEITEVLSNTKLGFNSKPVVIFNVEGCYDSFVSSLHALVDNGFLDASEAPFIEVKSLDELIAAFDGYV